MSAEQNLRLAGWLALRGVLANPRENLLRLGVSVVAAVIMLLGCSLEPTALARSARVADSILPLSSASSSPGEHRTGVRVRIDDDYYRGKPIHVVSMTRVGEDAPKAYDGVQLPEPGQLVVSPALADLRAGSSELTRRYPGTVVDDVPESRLVGPQALVVWRYDGGLVTDARSGWLGEPGDVRRDETIANTVPSEVSYAIPMIGVGFLVPLLALMALLATLGGARREQRLAALRLVGLTDRHAKLAAALEDGLLSLASLALGGILYAALVPLLAPRMPVEGGVWAQDVGLAWPATAVLLVALPVTSVVASLLGLRSLATSALGAERRTTVREPRWWRVLPLLVGLTLLGLVLSSVVADPAVQSPMLLVASVLLMLGLAGSLAFVVRTAAGRAARRSESLPALLVARRIERDPSRATRVGVGLTLMITMAGPLLVFFPLISDLGAPALARLTADVGPNTLVSYLPAGASSGEGASGSGVTGSARLTTVDVRVSGRQGETSRLLVADCEDLADVTTIRAADCRRGLVVPHTGSRLPPSPVTAVREVVDSRDGTVQLRPMGRPFAVPQDPVSSTALGRLEDALGTGAVLLIPADTARVPLHSLSATMLTGVKHADELEGVRTAVLAETGATSLTVGEMHAIASRTTHELQLVAGIAAALIVCIAGFATLITAYEHVRGTVAERRLLTIGGAPPSLFRRTLLLQMLLPTAAAVFPAVALSLLLALGFVRLLTYSDIPVPVAGILGAGSLALIAPLVATLLVVRLATAEPVTVTGE